MTTLELLGTMLTAYAIAGAYCGIVWLICKRDGNRAANVIGISLVLFVLVIIGRALLL